MVILLSLYPYRVGERRKEGVREEKNAGSEGKDTGWRERMEEESLETPGGKEKK